MYTFLVSCTQMSPEIPSMYHCSPIEFNTINIVKHFARIVVHCFVSSLVANKFPAVPSLGSGDMQLQKWGVKSSPSNISMPQRCKIKEFPSRLMQVIKANNFVQFQ